MFALWKSLWRLQSEMRRTAHTSLLPSSLQSCVACCVRGCIFRVKHFITAGGTIPISCTTEQEEMVAVGGIMEFSDAEKQFFYVSSFA